MRSNNYVRVWESAKEVVFLLIGDILFEYKHKFRTYITKTYEIFTLFRYNSSQNMGTEDIRFIGVPQKKVNINMIRSYIEDKGPKRINFASNHANALRRVEGKKNVIGKLVLPFVESFEAIAQNILSLDRFLFPSQFGNSFYRQIYSEEEYKKLETFINHFKEIVYLRDTLDLSIALSMHETEPGKRTLLGEHEFMVKYRSEQLDTNTDKDALVAEMQRCLEEMPYFKDADYICAVPSSKPFMKEIINELSGFGFIDISNKVSWQNKSGSLKNVETADEKLDMIQLWNLQFAENIDLKGKTILLVDDMYQSGVTMQYIAMRMKESGAKRVFGMALVKSLGN